MNLRTTVLFSVSLLLSSTVWAGASLGPLLQQKLARGLKDNQPVQVAVRTDGTPLALAKGAEARARNWLQLSLTPKEIRQLAENPHVELIRLPHYARTKNIISEGVAVTRADALHAQGYTGQGVRIAVLDVGFADYAQHLGKELPAQVGVKNFNSLNFETTIHGRAVAEIVHDMAPDAELTLVAFGTDVEYLQAIDWLKSQNPPFDIVTASIGFDNIGPLNGLSEITQAADSLAAVGTLYFNAAGNEQQQYWSGLFSDPDGNGWHNFNGDDERFKVELNKVEPFQIILNWDDWGSDPIHPQASQDYDLYLWCPDTTEFTEATACQVSNGIQNGGSMSVPLEIIETPSPKGGNYYIGIKRSGGDDNRLLRISFFNEAGIFGLEYRVPDSTLSHPADGFNVIAVGAYQYTDVANDVDPDIRADDPVWDYSDWSNDLPPEYFSSLGPTWDGRHKPDLSAPDGVSTEAYGEEGFFGTSAATPHVAGAAALLLSQYPGRSVHELYDLLLGMSMDVEPLGMDDAHGAGRLDLNVAAINPWVSPKTTVWHNPDQNGHGFSVVQEGNRMVVLWYFYDKNGDPAWFLAAGEMNGSVLDADLYHFTGPAMGMQGITAQLFDAQGSTVEAAVAGRIHFAFRENGRKADVHLQLDGSDSVAAMDDTVVVEPLLHAPAATNDNMPYITEFTGLWNNADENGHGFFISKQGRIRSPNHYFWPTDDTAIFWYSYDPYATAARWWLGSGATGVSDDYSMAGDGLGEYPIKKFFLDRPISDGDRLEDIFSIDLYPVKTTRQGGIEFHGLHQGVLNGYYHYSPFHVELPLNGMVPYHLN